MVTHMKTTVEIPDALLAAARRVAARDGLTLRQLVEEGLRRVVGERRKDLPYRMRRATFRGQGLQPGLADASWERIRDLTYEGRGS
jgi:Arc/MetJ family transcription regulator